MTLALRRTAISLVAASAAATTLVLAPLAHLGTLTAANAATGCPTPKTSVVRAAPGAGKTIALTFDDGPSKFTPQILEILRRNNVRATFFDTGAHIAADPDMERRVAAEGHLIANHTWGHFYPTQVRGGWSRSYLGDQFDRTNALVRQLTGQSPCFFRPPGGYQTSGMVETARSHGMSTVMWSIDTEDWKQPGVTATAATRRIIARAEAGVHQAHPIVLMHSGKASHEPESQVSSNRSNDVRALPAILAFYKNHGYRFVDMLGRSGLPPAPTTLSMGTTPSEVTAGRTVQAAAGTLRAITGPVSGVPVSLYGRQVGTLKWTLRGTHRTDSHGHVAISDTPKVSTEYLLKFSGGSRYRAATASGARRISVRPVAPNPAPSPDPDPDPAPTVAPTP